MSSTVHTLDYNKFFSLSLDYDQKRQQLKFAVTKDGSPWPRFVDAITGLIRLTDTAPANQAESSETLRRPLNQDGKRVFPQVRREFTLYLGTEPIATYQISPAGDLEQTFRRPLTVDETRRIGNFYHCEPYPQRREGLTWEENQSLLSTAKNAVFTDIHTHSSGQISAHGLLDTALRINKPCYYPIELLKEAGIPVHYDHIPKSQRKNIPRIPFRPTELPGVKYPTEVEAADLHYLQREHPEDLEKLIARLSLRADRQSTFKHVEHYNYRFRYPFSKDPRLTKAIREEEAREYVTQGVRFALSSFVGIDDPHILRTLHEVANDAEADPHKPDFTQRFMIGIPRNLPPEKMEEALEKAKIMMDSPYIMGVDMLGYEANKTKEFVAILDKFAAWANEHKPGSFIRVHAGENDKNHDNVKDFLKVAVKYKNLNYFVGHGVYGMDEETIALAKRLSRSGREQLTLEFNPSSNIALNNINDVKQVPFAAAIENHLPFILSSDSAGLYHTDATQLGLAAYYAGLDAKGFGLLRHHQEHVMHRMKAYSELVANRTPDWEMPAGKEAKLNDIIERLGRISQTRTPPTATLNPEAIAAKLKADEETAAAKQKAYEDAIAERLKTDQVSLIEPNEHPPELEGKAPITIIGSSGASWKRLTPGQQRESAIAVDMLIHALGDNCYIVQGRNKKIGLSKVINQSLHESNGMRKKTGQSELFNVGMLVNPIFDLHDRYKHLSHMIHIPGQQLQLPDALVDHTFNHDGVLVAIGGAAFTSDTILEADQRGIHAKHPDNRKMMLLLGSSGGASAEKANALHPDYNALDGRQLIKKLYTNRPDLFPPQFRMADVNALYKASSARVTTYGYNMADSSIVSQPQLIAKKAKTNVQMPG